MGATDVTIEEEIASLDGNNYGNEIESLLLRCLSGDLVDVNSETTEWKSDAGSRFWRYVELKEVLNVWVSLTPDGISQRTCQSGFAVVDLSKGYDRTRDLVEYTAQRMTGKDGWLPRRSTFLAYGLKQHEEQRWWTMGNMCYGHAYLWKAQQSPTWRLHTQTRRAKDHG